MLTNSLITAFGCILTTVIMLRYSGRITVRQYAGSLTITYTITGVLCAVAGWNGTLYVVASGTAVFAWLWWHSGGGDGTRRLLKSWARRFQGVRRTAPQGA